VSFSVGFKAAKARRYGAHIGNIGIASHNFQTRRAGVAYKMEGVAPAQECAQKCARKIFTGRAQISGGRCGNIHHQNYISGCALLRGSVFLRKCSAEGGYNQYAKQKPRFFHVIISARPPSLFP
jgi:hypothetical protein